MWNPSRPPLTLVRSRTLGWPQMCYSHASSRWRHPCKMMATLQLVLFIALGSQFCEAQQQRLVSFTFRTRIALILILDLRNQCCFRLQCLLCECQSAANLFILCKAVIHDLLPVLVVKMQQVHDILLQSLWPPGRSCTCMHLASSENVVTLAVKQMHDMLTYAKNMMY